ncbi:T9SS type A sorting domain-containing protein [Algibacter aquimarinus]|uniref:Secretion system C-terminal sorting domain-containing protein n=1 Tax=Algibacter aquimarinus TaxID=1136748 RepID=A0ABP9HBN4_9FLAO
MRKITPLKSLTFLIAFLSVVTFGFGQSIFDNPIPTIPGTNPGQSNPYTFGQNVNANITVSGIGRGSGVTGRVATGRYNTSSWNTTTLDNTAYLEFTLTPNTAYEIDFVSFEYNSQASNASISNFAFRSSLDGYTTDIGTPTVTGTTIDLSGATYQNITSAITFRFYVWGASSVLNAFSINDFTFNGVVSPASCTSSITWDGAVWSNGTGPDLTTLATLNASYNTTTDGGSISACSLIVANGATLNIADNDYVEVDNNLFVNTGGIITVQPYGAFIQNNDSGTVTNNGLIEVAKETAPLSNWYEYTYWSSPVSGALVQDALSDSDASRRFTFTAQNFLDATAETANNNAVIAGQDDIDDNGDDWQSIAGTTVMQAGIGYAATHSEAAFIVPPGPFTPPQFRYTFQGDFNNGIINVPVYRNDGSALDNNWNFLGNPYPSAIEIDAFMTENMYNAATNPTGTLEGAIYFWSQNTDFADTANGNQALNFDTTDYATHNGTGGTTGGDGVTPNGFIPSGQGFFVSFAESAPSNTGTVVFNNAMRSLSLSPDNSQFFKSSNTKKSSSDNANKLWLDLTSDNGVFNQILVGYVDGATDGEDGAYYDARKVVAPKAFAALYSSIEGSANKFVIQGKSPNTLDTDEVINLGFSTTIDVPTLYKLSIANLQGDFLTNNTVYLKDNLLDKLHDLSASDYTFTSAVGEFNSRFEIVFSASSLSTDNTDLDLKALTIVQLDNNNVRFKMSDNRSIQSVNIYDVLGRQLYNLKGDSNSETYNLSNLNDAVYLAKVELSDGSVITKKAIKR